MYKKLFLLILLMIIIGGCSIGRITRTNFYILEYFKHLEKEDLHLEKPFDYSVFVVDTSIPRTYNRKQIVIRHFGPKITYADNDLWGVNLTDIIPALITQRLNRYGVFKHTQREFLDKRPDYEITTSIYNLELSKFENFNQARLNMDFYLSKAGEEGYLIHHRVNIEDALLDDTIETFVLKVNEIILNETDKFIRKIESFFNEGIVSESEEIELSEETGIRRYSDQTIRTTGMGSLLLPAITKSDNEPYYIVLNSKGEEVISSKMGIGVPLPVGNYIVLYGSGTENQMMIKKDVQVIPRYKTIIEPDWGCLTVDIVDETRDFVKVRYEIFDGETGSSFGTDFPVEEEFGEQQKIWVLKPGLYKVTINDEPFNAYKDFTTVYIEKGKSQELRIVVGTDDDGNPTNLVGAGILEESEVSNSNEKIRFSSAVHGNINFTSNNETNKDDPETTITLNSQLDNRLIYDLFPFYYIMKNLVEVGTTKSSDTDFRISTDDLTLDNTLIFYFLRNLGLYARLDTDTHILVREDYEPGNYIKIDSENDTTEVALNADKVRIKPAFFPLILKEGIGINIRLLNKPKANLSLRTGFGMRQEFNNNAYILSESIWTDQDQNEYKIYQEESSDYKIGTEVSLVGNFTLPLNLSYNTNADFLFPIDKDDTISMEWENGINLRFFKHLSLDYKLKLFNKQQDDGSDFIVNEHSLFLRITYLLR